MTDTQMDVDQFRAEARAWITSNLERRPAGADAEARGVRTDEEIVAARALQRRLFDAGFAGITYPAEYGGRGLTAAHERAFREESADFVMPDFGAVGGVTVGPIGRSLLEHGSPEFLQWHIPRILSGETIWCQFYSEPEAGSDLAGIRTRATRDGDQWLLNGSKIWSTGAFHANWAMCLARTDWDAPKHRGLTWFAVPTNAPGLTIRPITQINGTAEFCEEFLDEVVVTDADIIGEVNHGWSVTQTMLVYERGAGESGVSLMEPRELAPDLVELARRGGRTDDPAIRQAIARAHVADYAQFHLGARIAARLRSASTPDPAVAAYSKLARGVYTPLRARAAIEIGGSDALTWPEGDDAGQRPAIDYLNGRIVSIAAGSNEMQRNGIGERVLGLPREPSFDSSIPFNEVLRKSRGWNGRVG
ncbi:MAG: acyl-CoA dehydrogenase protein [Ilumatobacteraceae bacterium]|nr:acyl-CoA dehydrogenase protein [Ilumatobacteraceae bacterium]